MLCIWLGWKEFTHRATVYQTIVFLNVLYAAVLGPSAAVARLVGTRLIDLETSRRSSYWTERKPTLKTIAEMTRQY